MVKEINVGVVGCGYWGPNLIRNFRSLPGCSLRMMCDLDQARLDHLKSVYPGVEDSIDYKHMLNGAGLDAVVVATSVKLHFPMAKAACWPANTPSSRNQWRLPPPSARN